MQVLQSFTVTIRDPWNNVIMNADDNVVTAAILQSPSASIEYWNFQNGTIKVQYIAQKTGTQPYIYIHTCTYTHTHR